MKKRISITTIFILLILTVLLLLVLLPIYWTIIMSFDRDVVLTVPDPPRFYPKRPSLFNYQMAAQAVPIGQLYVNTLIVTTIYTFISVISSLSCAYAFAKGKFAFKRFWFMFILAVMMIPFESRMLPLFLQYKTWGMLDTWWPLIFGSLAWPYGIFLAKQFVDAIPDSLREAALIDGAPEIRIFLRIIVPLCGPIIATLIIFQVVQQWNSFVWPLVVINKASNQMISVGLAMFNVSETSRYLGPRLAIAMLGLLPMLILFVFLQKYIVQSVMLYGVKE
ncbi:glycerol-3-phosphate ABC transporter permease [Spirochaetia bacterium]|nr:glycerol-3-phosphate ABC transporter permease [Spirochaetia bacterium]